MFLEKKLSHLCFQFSKTFYVVCIFANVWFWSASSIPWKQESRDTIFDSLDWMATLTTSHAQSVINSQNLGLQSGNSKYIPCSKSNSHHCFSLIVFNVNAENLVLQRGNCYVHPMLNIYIYSQTRFLNFCHHHHHHHHHFYILVKPTFFSWTGAWIAVLVLVGQSK